MDLSDLPVELVEEIAAYLSKDDILACSHVNTLWWNTFNVDRIWKRLCKLHPKFFDNCVNKLPLLPDGHFNHGCNRRKLCLNESKVKQNLSIGNFHIAKVDYDFVECTSALYVTDDIGNHWLFISCVKKCKYMLHVFNINDDPVIHVSINTGIETQFIFTNDEELFVPAMKFENKKLLFNDGYTVCVYEFAYPCYEMKLLKLLKLRAGLQFVDDSQIVPVNNHILQFCLQGEDTEDMKQLNCNVFDADGLLKSVVNADSLLRYHVFEADFQSFCYLRIKSNGSDLVVVSCKIFNRDLIPNFNVALVFSVAKLEYLNFCVKFIDVVCFDTCENVIVFLSKTEDLKEIFVYLVENGNVSLHKSFRIPPDSCTCRLVPGTKEVIITQRRAILVHNISSGMQINEINYNGYIISSTLLSDSLLLIELRNDLKTKCAVQNFKYNMKFYELHTELDKCEMVIKNPNCPVKIIQFEMKKCVVKSIWKSKARTEIVFISFW